MRIQWLVTGLGALALVIGCTDANTGDSGGGGGIVLTNDGSMGAGGNGGAGGGSGETVEHLRLSYVKRVAPRNGAAPVVDMVVYDFDDNEEFNLTSGGGVVDCGTALCRLNADMTWIGWLEPGAGGFVLKVAPVDPTRKRVLVDQMREVRDEVHNFEFTTYRADRNDPSSDIVQVIYTRGQAAGSDDTIDVVVEPAAGYNPGECGGEPGPTCRNLVGAINSDGDFRVTSFGSLVILVETTLSTMTLNFFNLSNGAQQTIYTFGEQMMTGSMFSGRHPIGLAPDASYLAVFTRDEFIWRVNALVASPNPPDPEVHDLFEVKTHPEGDCRRMGDYNFNQVQFNPVFSSDSQWIYFLAKGDCSQRRDNENPTNRDDYDILRIRADVSGLVENVTRNLRASHWSNHDMGDFDLSPDGARIAFTAQRPNNARSRAVWIIDPENGNYNCDRGEPIVSIIDGRERCEFIADDRENADVIYRDLTFHTVAVSVE
jgi:hypothetical protein